LAFDAKQIRATVGIGRACAVELGAAADSIAADQVRTAFPVFETGFARATALAVTVIGAQTLAAIVAECAAAELVLAGRADPAAAVEAVATVLGAGADRALTLAVFDTTAAIRAAKTGATGRPERTRRVEQHTVCRTDADRVAAQVDRARRASQPCAAIGVLLARQPCSEAAGRCTDSGAAAAAAALLVVAAGRSVDSTSFDADAAAAAVARAAVAVRQARAAERSTGALTDADSRATVLAQRASGAVRKATSAAERTHAVLATRRSESGCGQ